MMQADPKIPLILLFLICTVPAPADTWKTKPLLSEFYAEGAGAGDLNGDGHPDIAYGPYWFAGPDFEKRMRFADGEPFDGSTGYSDNFFSFVRDFNGDGKNDILVFGFPGKSARLYLNSDADRWEMIEIADAVANESPHLSDLIPGGHPEIVCARESTYGYYEAGEDATKPWQWHTISGPKEAATPFGHGLGVGDINGDGRPDLVEKMHWYEQPAEPGNGPWRKHKWALVPYGGGGAQILVDDVDGDGDNDLITSLNAHGYGVSWFEQHAPGKFGRHDIIGESSTENPYGVAFSQPHALALADIDGDGRNDFVTGKRYLAHKGKDPGGLQEPVVYWFRNTTTEDGIEFVPHLVDNDSGVGVDVTVTDLNGDGAPDIISGNKRGLAIHLRDPGVAFTAPEPWKKDPTPQPEYGSGLSPEEATARYRVPEGFSVDLIAAEPEVTQPIAMCFDARGRIWVVEGHTYPVRNEGGWNEGKDRVIILEDTDSDGTFETKKTFLENVNLASGIEVGFGGVYIGAAPYLLFFPDKDQNDIPDGEPEILLDGWGWQDTHETLNAFTWGPDGWLYGCHGVFTHSKVGKPGTPEEEREPLNAGVWRYHPTKHRFEVWARGTSNPWGVDFNEYGDWFVSACVIPHFHHLSQGGRHMRQAGQHFNPYIFGDIQTIADHDHYLGNIRALWGAKNANVPEEQKNFTNLVGGGHAHCGLTIYEAPEFPEEYRGRAFFHNLHGHRIVSERLEKNGASYVARHAPDFAYAEDHNQVGVTVMQGPDGALYSSDWQDSQTCHHRDVEIWDRSNGRIFRIRHGGIKPTTTRLTEMEPDELVATLAHENRFHANQARRLLQEGATTGQFEKPTLRDSLTNFESRQTTTALRLRAYWAMHACGVLEEDDLIARLSDPDPYLRGWSLQFLGESGTALSDPAREAVLAMAKTEPSAIVRRYLASLLQRIPLEQRWALVDTLVTRTPDKYDPAIPYLVWFAVEPMVAHDPDRALSEILPRTSWEQLNDFIIRRAAVFPGGRTSLMTSLSSASSPGAFLDQIKRLMAALDSLPPIERPAGWEKMKAKGTDFAEKDPAIRKPLEELGAIVGDADFFAPFRALAANANASQSDRTRALQLLRRGKDPELGRLARETVALEGAIRTASLEALALFPSSETAKSLVTHLEKFNSGERNRAINLLSRTPGMALVLLKAVHEKQLPASLVSPVLLDQFERFDNDEINELIEANWTRGGGSVDLAALSASIKQWEAKLNPRMMDRANASRGRALYKMTCGTCHVLFNDGIHLGPNLTGSNRGDLHYLLENVLAPNAVIGKDYQLNIFTLADGQVVSGMVQSETGEFFKIAMPGGVNVDVNKADVKDRRILEQSLMPAGLFDTMPVEQVADLVKYLASTSQVPLPGQPAATPENASVSALPPPAEGILRIEGESLVGRFQPGGGQSVVQNMQNFPDSWSEGKQLWWRGGKPGDIYTLKLDGIEPGNYEVTLFATRAKDYATAKFAINGQLQEADFFHPTVTLADPVLFGGVNVSPTEPLQIDIHLTGKNEAAIGNFMVGLDRIELKKTGKLNKVRKN